MVRITNRLQNFGEVIRKGISKEQYLIFTHQLFVTGRNSVEQ